VSKKETASSAQPTKPSQFAGFITSKVPRHRKRFFIILGAWVGLVVLCIAAGIIYVTVFLPKTAGPNSSSSDTQIPASAPAVVYAQLDQVAQQKVHAGDTKAAAQSYADAVKTAATPQDKNYLYSSEAAIYVNSAQYDQALQPALDAFAAHQDEGTAELVAYIYEQQGDKPNAVVYYQKAKDLVDPNDPTSYGADFYQERIDALK